MCAIMGVQSAGVSCCNLKQTGAFKMCVSRLVKSVCFTVEAVEEQARASLLEE